MTVSQSAQDLLSRSVPVGRVVATERKPNTPHEFHFLATAEAPVGIGVIVRVDGEPAATRAYGVVVEGFRYAEELPEVRLYTAQVLRHVPEEPLQPVAIGNVYLAAAAEVALALRMDGYCGSENNTAIPVGVYRAAGFTAPVYLDADFLLGPEAAHLNISGMSGLATKTSAIEFILQSTFAHFPKSKGSIAAVCFNVKGPDLLFLDKEGPLTETDRALYEALDVPPTPFANVEYFAPYTARGLQLNTLRTHP
ncbi:MAG: ATP-binding protein, partial [Gemmatimonadaceae bacterium]